MNALVKPTKRYKSHKGAQASNGYIAAGYKSTLRERERETHILNSLVRILPLFLIISTIQSRISNLDIEGSLTNTVPI